MEYREIKPEGILKHFIKCFWLYENNEEDIVHTIMPDGYFDLLILFVNEKLVSVNLTGIWTEPQHIDIRKNTTYFGVRFKLLAAEYIFSRELTTILNETKELPVDFWDINTYTRRDFDSFVSNTISMTKDYLNRIKEIDDRKFKLFDLAYKNESTAVSALSKEVAWSSRQINRYFNAQYGLSLKEFLNIVRFESYYKKISHGQVQPENDFFDQSHFIKEVKKYSGVTPKELSKNEGDRFLQLITVNK